MYSVIVYTNHHTSYTFDFSCLELAREFATKVAREGLWLSHDESPDGVESFYSTSAIQSIKVFPPEPAAKPARRKAA